MILTEYKSQDCGCAAFNSYQNLCYSEAQSQYALKHVAVDISFDYGK